MMKVLTIAVLVAILATVEAAIRATVTVNIDTAIHITDEKFLSLGMDSNLIRDRWETFDFNSHRLMTLAKALSPTYLRLSGTDGDRMIFNASVAELHVQGNPPFPTSKFSMTVDDWDKINMFCSKAGWDLMFGFNGQIRHTFNNRTVWNPANALDLLDYSVKKGYTKHLHFQLGNEPNSWPNRKFEVGVSGKQIAADFASLRKILNTIYAGYFNNSVIVGPDISGLSTHGYARTLLSDYLNNIEPTVIQAISFHHYYGGDKQVPTYKDPKRLDGYIALIDLIQSIRANSSQPKMPIWNSEAGSDSYPSFSGLEEAFVADFMLVDHLGMSARMGLDVLTRQTFYGFWFALVDNALLPRPTYWFALLFKRLVGPRVLDVQVQMTGASDTPHRLRLYAHCTTVNGTAKNLSGAVTIYGMNLYDDPVELNLGKTQVQQYLLTTDYLATAITYLNGNRLEMPNNSTLPNLIPSKIMDGSKIVLPANSVALYVLPEVKAKACV